MNALEKLEFAKYTKFVPICPLCRGSGLSHRQPDKTPKNWNLCEACNGAGVPQ